MLVCYQQRNAVTVMIYLLWLPQLMGNIKVDAHFLFKEDFYYGYDIKMVWTRI